MATDNSSVDDTPCGSSAWILRLIEERQNFTPRRLVEPGPSPQQLEALFAAAAAAPDHGELGPWRFVLIPPERRGRLGEVFRAALLERDASANAAQQADACEKAQRAPCLLLAIVELARADEPIPDVERIVSLGCAIQNMLLVAQAMGFGSGLSSGQALRSVVLREAFGLREHEQAVCFVSFGTASQRRPSRRRRSPAQIVSSA